MLLSRPWKLCTWSSWCSGVKKGLPRSNIAPWKSCNYLQNLHELAWGKANGGNSWGEQSSNLYHTLPLHLANRPEPHNLKSHFTPFNIRNIDYIQIISTLQQKSNGPDSLFCPMIWWSDKAGNRLLRTWKGLRGYLHNGILWRKDGSQRGQRGSER